MAETNIFREVASKADIVKVVSYFLGSQAIHKKGNVYYSICPFHDDHHPSMRIDPKRNIYKCFSCGAGGDAITFAENFGKLEKIEALKKVADICNIPVEISEFKQNEDYFLTNFPQEIDALKALNYYYQLVYQTKDGKEGADYLKARGISEETRLHFKIGFAPEDSKKAIEILRQKNGFSVSTLERAGIIKNSGDLEDRYKSRLMFPITNEKGYVVGFSGRQVRDGQSGGKYINYPETELFQKNRILYHFDKAKETMRKDGYLYLCEGFMDVIAFQRVGINSVAGLMGTALTDYHLEMIKKFNVQVRLALDFDQAGQTGEEKALASLLKYKIPVKVVRPTRKGKDPDAILSRFGEEVFTSIYTQNLLDPVLFLLARVLNGAKSLTETGLINQFLSKAGPFFQSLTEVEQSKDLDILAKVTSLKTDVLKSVLMKENPKIEEREEAKEERIYKPRTKYKPKKNDKPYTDYLLGGKYKFADDIDSYLDSLSEVADDIIDHSILKNEAQIIFAEMKSRSAYHKFSIARISLLYEPFYTLNSLVTEFYLNNQDAMTFENKDFEDLIAKIVSTKTDFTNEEFDDAIDLSDLQESDELSLSEKEKSLLLNLIQISQKTINSDFDELGLNKIIEMEKIYNKMVSCKKDAVVLGYTPSELKSQLSKFKLQLNKIRNS